MLSKKKALLLNAPIKSAVHILQKNYNAYAIAWNENPKHDQEPNRFGRFVLIPTISDKHKSPILFPWLRSVKRPCWVWLYLWLCVIGLSVQLMVVVDSGGFNWVFCLGLGGCGLCGYGIGLRKSIGFLTSSVQGSESPLGSIHGIAYSQAFNV